LEGEVIAYLPQDIPASEAAYGAVDTSQWMPAYEAVPVEFKQLNNKWNILVTGWWFDGVHPALVVKLRAKEGIDRKKALDQLHACIRSFEPAHNHKMAACAYLMSLWFEEIP
jgi:hypothetical protein